MKLAVLQFNVGSDKIENLAKAERILDAAIQKENPDWIALPEMFDFAGGDFDRKKTNAELLGEGAAYKMLQRLAKKHGVWIHGGSFHEWLPEQQRIGNTSVVFHPEGKEAAIYRKLHLFDITTPDGAPYHESASIEAGENVVSYECGTYKIGCAICYDLRFPELFQALRLKGAHLTALPSAFTQITGRDHWDILLRARAIETQCYVAAPAQTGAFQQGASTRYTYGHSAIIDPWGKILAQMGAEEGFVVASTDLDRLKTVRANMPVMQHRRFLKPMLKETSLRRKPESI